MSFQSYFIAYTHSELNYGVVLVLATATFISATVIVTLGSLPAATLEYVLLFILTSVVAPTVAIDRDRLGAHDAVGQRHQRLHLRQAAAVISEESSADSHAATVGLILNKPVLVGAMGATRHLEDGVTVSVDCARGIVQTLPQ